MNALRVIRETPIRLKDGRTVPFGAVMSPQQEDVINTLTTHDRVAVVKARQIGVSTIARAWAVTDVLRKPGTTHMLVSNKLRSSRELLRIDTRMATGISKLIGSNIIRKSTNDSINWFNGSRSLCFSGSASNDRGYTVDSLHISEYAHVEHGEDILATILPSMSPKGRVLLESTPSHYGDPLHMITNSSHEQGRWKVLFFPWFSFADYAVTPSEDFKPNDDERALQSIFGLTDAQLEWRRLKIGEYSGDEIRFKREYPSTVHEAYSLAQGSWLTDDLVSTITSGTYSSKEEPHGTIVITNANHVRDNRRRYCVGFDPAGGTGGDYAVIVILDRSSMEVVQVISSNQCAVEAMADRCAVASKHWFNAPILFERNNHGHAVEVVLKKHNCVSTPWTTTAPSKVQLFDGLRTLLYGKLLQGLDTGTISELRTLRRKEGLAPEAAQGHYDDRVVALALACQMNKDLPSVPKPDWLR